MGFIFASMILMWETDDRRGGKRDLASPGGFRINNEPGWESRLKDLLAPEITRLHLPVVVGTRLKVGVKNAASEIFQALAAPEDDRLTTIRVYTHGVEPGEVGVRGASFFIVTKNSGGKGQNTISVYLYRDSP